MPMRLELLELARTSGGRAFSSISLLTHTSHFTPTAHSIYLTSATPPSPCISKYDVVIMERPEKRQRSVAAPAEEQHSQHSCWKDVVAWIQSNGGTVHPALIFSSDRSVQTQVQTKDGGTENSAIPAGTMLIRIPSSCLLTVDTVSSTPFGKKLVNKIQSIFLQICVYH